VTYPLEANQTLENANPKDGTQTRFGNYWKVHSSKELHQDYDTWSIICLFPTEFLLNQFFQKKIIIGKTNTSQQTKTRPNNLNCLGLDDPYFQCQT
jgi:hypothetical protein